MKKESGAIPERSRRCKSRSIFPTPLEALQASGKAKALLA